MKSSDWIATAAIVLVVGAVWLGRRKGRAAFAAAVAEAHASGYASARAELTATQAVQVTTNVGGAVAPDDLLVRASALLAEYSKRIGATEHHELDRAGNDDNARVLGSGVELGNGLRNAEQPQRVDRLQDAARGVIAAGVGAAYFIPRPVASDCAGPAADEAVAVLDAEVMPSKETAKARYYGDGPTWIR